MAERPDPIERGFFREGRDGATVFFPWGLPRRGYRLPGPEAKRRAARAARLLLGSVLAAAAWASVALQRAIEPEAPSVHDAARALAAPLAALALAVAVYALWASRFVERLPPSDLVVPRETRLREAAALGAPSQLMTAGGILAAMSALLAGLEPRFGWIAALGVAVGLGLVGLGLYLRRLVRDGGRSR